MEKIAVIGGGITGVTTAYALVRRGFDVTLFEKHRYAAMETSYANGGQLSACNAEAWNHWPTILKGLRWMFRDDAPLLLNPKPSWHKISWFFEFMAAIPKYRQNTTETTRLAIAAREYLFGWAEEEGIEFDAGHTGLLHVYRDKAAFDHAAEVSKLLAAGGLERRSVTPQEMQSLEPTLADDYYGGFYTQSDSTGDIHMYANQLAVAAVRRGATCLYGHEIGAITTDGQSVGVTATHTQQSGDWTFDGVVVCAGTASRVFAAALGDRVNVYPVKGYSITVNLNDQTSREAAPVVSLLDDATKLVSSRLGDDRLRVAGSAEFNGFNHDIRADRIDPLIEWVERHFPNVNTRDVVPWAGLRPMMPDMMPRVGRGKAANVFYNTGHGHLGWTLSAATAQSIAAIVAESK